MAGYNQTELVKRFKAPGMTAPGDGPPVLDAPREPAMEPAMAPVSPFSSPNTSVRGYLDEAIRAHAPAVKGIADEAGRKSSVESYLRSLAPAISARGGSLSDIKGEKARVDGRLIDFYRDIEGAADPQYLDVTDEGGGDDAFDFMGLVGDASPDLQDPSMLGAEAPVDASGVDRADLAEGSPYMRELIKKLALQQDGV